MVAGNFKMSSKRKRVDLTIAEKVAIINLLKQVQSRKKLDRRYGPINKYHCWTFSNNALKMLINKYIY
jgi:hypothetical protein